MSIIDARPVREVAPCPPSPEVALEQRYRAGQGAITDFAESYRAWDKRTGAVLEHMDPIEQHDAAWECPHGRLSSDRKQTCDCYGRRNVFDAPDLMSTLTPKEFPMPEAPYGYKADGSPRKRPAPAPASLEKARAAKAAKAKTKAAVTGTPSPFLLKVVGDVEAEIARLTEARDELVKAAAA